MISNGAMTNAGIVQIVTRLNGQKRPRAVETTVVRCISPDLLPKMSQYSTENQVLHCFYQLNGSSILDTVVSTRKDKTVARKVPTTSSMKEKRKSTIMIGALSNAANEHRAGHLNGQIRPTVASCGKPTPKDMQAAMDRAATENPCRAGMSSIMVLVSSRVSV